MKMSDANAGPGGDQAGSRRSAFGPSTSPGTGFRESTRLSALGKRLPAQVSGFFRKPKAESRKPVSEARSLPNLLTYARILAVPAFLWAWYARRPELALALFAGAALTDGIDGLLARLLRQRTRLGAILDPVADKLLTVAVLAALSLDARLPMWLLVLVLVRDAGIAAGVAALRARGRPVPTSPTRLGKYSTFLLAWTLGLALVREAWGGDSLAAWEAVAMTLAGACTLLTIVQYSAAWRHRMRAPAA